MNPARRTHHAAPDPSAHYDATSRLTCRSTSGGSGAPDAIVGGTGGLSRIDPADHAILAMRLDGEPPFDIARTLGLREDAVTARIAAILAELEPLASAA